MKDPTGPDQTRPPEVNDRQSIAIDTLIAGRTHREAAQAAGVQRSTVTGWCNHNIVFIAEWNQRRRQRLAASGERLHQTMSAALAESGADKIFLRLPEASRTQRAVLDAGFTPYVNEDLYLRPRGAHLTGGWEPAGGALFDAGPTATWDMFRFYQRVVPAKTRETEGLTLNQRHDGLDLPRDWRQRSTHILERDGVVVGWSSVLAKGRSSVLDILVDPSNWDLGQAMVGAAVDSVGETSSICCIVPEYQQPLGSALRVLGFNKIGEFFDNKGSLV